MLELDAELPDDLTLDDVAEHVLLDVLVPQVGRLHGRRRWSFIQRTPKPALTIVYTSVST